MNFLPKKSDLLKAGLGVGLAQLVCFSLFELTGDASWTLPATVPGIILARFWIMRDSHNFALESLIGASINWLLFGFIVGLILRECRRKTE